MNNREAFISWAESRCYYLDASEDGHYIKNSTALAWEIWQAALASQQDHIPDVGEMVQSQAQQPALTMSQFATKADYEAAMQSQAQQESQWNAIETAPKNKKIIVTYKNALGKNRTVFAKYIEKFTEESTLDTECETDYCEEDDTFYLKEGWVELIDNWDEFSSVYFDSQNVPTHWMDIPPAPEGDKP